jgi:hypothetical protein
MTDKRSLGQIGYEAYGEDACWKAFDGRPMPRWADLRADIAARWEVAANAIGLQAVTDYKTDFNRSEPT